MYGLLMDDNVKMRRNWCGKFYMPPRVCHQIKIVTEINILEKNKEVACVILAKEMGTKSVF